MANRTYVALTDHIQDPFWLHSSEPTIRGRGLCTADEVNIYRKHVWIVYLELLIMDTLHYLQEWE